MKILSIKKEAFDASMPPEVRNWMTQNVGTWRNKETRASRFRKFDPSRAKFADYSSETVSNLRQMMKDGEVVLFITLEDDWQKDTTIAVYPDPDNATNRLKLVGEGANQYKEKSFKWLVEHAKSIWGASTATGADLADLRTDRYNSRKGIISRDNDSAKDSNGRWDFNGEDWKKDASGYWYDANKYAKKLAALHEGDAAYYIQKSAEIFKSMVEDLADSMKRMASNIQDYTFDTFGNKSFNRIVRDGQRLIEDASRKMEDVNDDGEALSMSIEEWNSKRAKSGSDPLSQEEYDERIEHIKRKLKSGFSELKQYQRQLKELLQA